MKAGNKVLGIDIGSYATKVVQGSYNGVTLRLDRYGIFKDLSVTRIQNRIVNKKQYAAQLKKQLRRSKLRSKNAVLSFSNSDVVMRRLKLPLLKDEKLKTNLMLQLPEFLPLELSEYVIDYKVINEFHEGEQKGYEVLVMAISKQVVNEYIAMLKMAGIKVIAIDVEANARGNFIQSISGGEKGETNGIIDIGYQYTSVSIFVNGQYYINRTIDWGTQDLNSPNKNTMSLSSLLEEIARVFTFYRSQNNMQRIDKLFAIGGGVMDERVQGALFSQLRSVTTTINQFSNTKKMTGQIKSALDLCLIFNALSLLVRGDI